MNDSLNIWLPNAEITTSCGTSLSHCLYAVPLEIHLLGDLGTGKTTFFQGFARGLGIRGAVSSPTYALEQRYTTERWGELVHIDLYRLSPAEARRLLTGSEDHEGIRCIEWAERAELSLTPSGIIEIRLLDLPGREGRSCSVRFGDIPLPSREEMESWRREVLLPANVIAHCDAVAAFAVRLSEHLTARGTLVRTLALQRAAEVHDLLRFLDFRRGGSGSYGIAPSPEQQSCWIRWRERYPDLGHEEACAAFLRDRGYEALAEIVRVHGLVLPAPERRTTEQKLLYYADKRVAVDRVVSLDERFADFRRRYSDGNRTKEGMIWHAEAQALERELFPEGVPY